MKEFIPGKIMYSGLSGRIRPLQFLRHHEAEVNIYYGRFYYNGEFGQEAKLFGLDYIFETREEAIKFALSELSESIAKLPPLDELRAVEKSYNVGK